MMASLSDEEKKKGVITCSAGMPRIYNNNSYTN